MLADALSKNYGEVRAVADVSFPGGRLEFGLGAGWNEFEHTMLGLPFDGAPERIERLDEAIRVIRALWGPEPRASLRRLSTTSGTPRTA